ncbi:MAG: TadE/TadG family type IV pilus assembly protein [Pseudomonadota bacterium]
MLMTSEFLRGGDRRRIEPSRFRKDETGSLTVFGLFIFLMIVMICGLAVDLMRYERERVAVQNTLDTAVVAATSLNQDADTDAEVEALVKQYFTKAGYDSDIVEVASNIEVPAGGDEETLRTVAARVRFDMDTAFMPLLGIDSLPGGVGTSAREGQQLIEIALVLDISGSMGWGTKLQTMREAAKEFVSFVIEKNGADRVMISIIPYNMQVQMSEDLAQRLTNSTTPNVQWNDPLTSIAPPPTQAGAIGSYRPGNPAARCARFVDLDFDSLPLAEAAAGLERSAKFARGNWGYAVPGGDFSSNAYWCGEGYPEMLLYQNNEGKLHTYIDSLTARGWTAIDYGVKWAAGVLDPSFRPIVQGMLSDSKQKRTDAQTFASTNNTTYVPPSEAWIVPDTVAGHPVNYGTANVFKYIVVMTDGANTAKLDLKDEFKSGPSRVWTSETLENEFDTNGNEFDGYLVEMPNNGENTRWYRPRNPNTTNDDAYLSQAQFEALTDVEQWSYHKVYERFSVQNVANYFFRVDPTARTEHQNAEIDTGGYATADTNLDRICQEAIDGGVEVYSVAFEAPPGGVTALQNCVNNLPGKFFNVAGAQLTEAFKAIAAEITKLRLTQ